MQQGRDDPRDGKLGARSPSSSSPAAAAHPIFHKSAYAKLPASTICLRNRAGNCLTQLPPISLGTKGFAVPAPSAPDNGRRGVCVAARFVCTQQWRGRRGSHRSRLVCPFRSPARLAAGSVGVDAGVGTDATPSGKTGGGGRRALVFRRALPYAANLCPLSLPAPAAPGRSPDPFGTCAGNNRFPTGEGCGRGIPRRRNLAQMLHARGHPANGAGARGFSLPISSLLAQPHVLAQHWPQDEPHSGTFSYRSDGAAKSSAAC